MMGKELVPDVPLYAGADTKEKDKRLREKTVVPVV
jgi:hypothetical protein